MRSLRRQPRWQGGMASPNMHQGARGRCLNMGNTNSKSSCTWFGVTQQLTKLVSSTKLYARKWISSMCSNNSMLFMSSKSNWTEWLCQSIWGLNSANQDMPKITGWFNLGTTRNSTATGVVPGANYTKRMAICDEITLDLSASLTCRGLAHRQSLGIRSKLLELR